MRISELVLSGKAIGVETTTDALQMITNEFQRQSYIGTFGNVEIVAVVPARYGCDYSVPAFTQQIAEYTAMKVRHCDRYGCE